MFATVIPVKPPPVRHSEHGVYKSGYSSVLTSDDVVEGLAVDGTCVGRDTRWRAGGFGSSEQLGDF